MADGYGHTTNFNLPLYQDNTPADLRDGYNSAMRSIDTDMLNISNGVNTANANLTALKTNLTALKTNLTALGADTPEKATALATNIANGENAHHLLAYMGITDNTSAGEHINAIEQNHTDTLNNTNALTALGAETVDKATALHNKINTALQPDTNQYFLITFGDSYASTPEHSWAIELGKLHPNLTLKNFAVSGNGYITKTGTYQQQLNKALADTSINNNNVKIVVVGGSRNDLDTTQKQETLTPAAKQLYSNLRQAYPNAKILAVPLMWDHKPPSAKWKSNAGAIIRGAIQSNAHIITVPWAWTWLLGDAEYFNDTDIHPNNNGCKIIANYIHTAIEGNYTGRQRTRLYQFQAEKPINLWISASGGTITYTLQCKSGISTAWFTNGLAIEEWAQRVYDDADTPNTWVPAITQGGNGAALFIISDTIKISAFPVLGGGTINTPLGFTVTADW